MQLMHHVERNIDGRGNYIFGADWYHNYWGKDVTLAHKKYIIHWPASSNLYTMIYVRWVCQTYLQSTLIPFVTVHVLCISFSRHLRPLGLWKVGFFLRLLEWITPTVAWPWEVEVSLWLVNPGQSQPHRSLLLNFLVLGVCVCGYQISCLHLLCVCGIFPHIVTCYRMPYAYLQLAATQSLFLLLRSCWATSGAIAQRIWHGTWDICDCFLSWSPPSPPETPWICVEFVLRPRHQFISWGLGDRMNCRATWELAEHIVRPCKNDVWIRFEDGEGDEMLEPSKSYNMKHLRWF